MKTMIGIAAVLLLAACCPTPPAQSNNPPKGKMSSNADGAQPQQH